MSLFEMFFVFMYLYYIGDKTKSHEAAQSPWRFFLC